VAVWSAVLLAAGCGQHDGASSAGPVPLEGICDVYVDDLCTALVRCTDSVYATVEECRSDHLCLGFAELKEEIAGGWTVYSQEGAGRCHAQVRADPCAFAKRYTFVPSLPKVLADCADGAVVGKRAVGEICIGDQSCVPGSFCSSQAPCQGVCKPLLQLGEGPCSAIDARCDLAANLECSGDVCRARATKPGDPCMTASDCHADDLWCDLHANVCARRRGEGEPCRLAGPECLAGLHCDAQSNSDGVCRPPAAAGGRCLDINDCSADTTCVDRNADTLIGVCTPSAGEGASCLSSRCLSAFSCVGGRCVARGTLGQPCSGPAAGDCTDNLECDAGVCRQPKHLGESCDSFSLCVVGNCRDGTCVPRGPAGSSCTGSSDCLSRDCEQNACKDPTPCWEVIGAP
jgi:hypothetical protein